MNNEIDMISKGKTRISGKNLWPLNGIIEEKYHGDIERVFADRPKSLTEMLERTTDEYPNNLAIVCEDVRLTYSDFRDNINRLSYGLNSVGNIRKNDRIAVLLTNCQEVPIIIFAASQIGAITVCLNNRLSPPELEYQLDNCGAKMLIVQPSFLTPIEDVIPRLKSLKSIYLIGVTGADKFSIKLGNFSDLIETVGNLNHTDIDESDTTLLLYTSGTTGHPKGVKISHRNIINYSLQLIRHLELKPRDIDGIFVPLFHITGLLTQFCAFVACGGTNVILPTYNTRQAMALIEKENINFSVSVPTIYWLMLVSPDFSNYDLSSFTKIVYGGAPASPELINKLSKYFPESQLVNTFGLTETTAQTILPHKDAIRKCDSIGLPLVLCDIKIVNEKGNDVSVDEVGELCVKGSIVSKGYWRNPEANKKAFDKEGYFHTGDMVKIDEEGYLYLMDRKSDMIIRGGENIYCVEVENAIYAHKKVLEAAAFGVPDRIFGEEVKAIIVLKDALTASQDEIREHLKNHLADYKIPKYIEFSDHPLPRNPGGKVMKHILKSEYIPENIKL